MRGRNSKYPPPQRVWGQRYLGGTRKGDLIALHVFRACELGLGDIARFFSRAPRQMSGTSSGSSRINERAWSLSRINEHVKRA